MEKDFLVVRNRLNKAKSVFEGGDVALLNLFPVRFVSTIVATSGTSGRNGGCSTSTSGARMLRFNNAYVNGIGFFRRFELVDVKSGTK